MKISLKEAARLITAISGYNVSRVGLRCQIKSGMWPYSHYRSEFCMHKYSHILLNKEDVISYAANYKPPKAGRPKK